SWQNELEQKISQSKSACVFVGPNGFGSWQQREKNLALDKQAGESTYRVIPVILPGNNDPTLGFLGLNTWIDLREEANTDLLLKAIHSTRHTHQRRNGNRTH
ncbi:MAG: TIR domain-containing protein, partial [Rhodothermales bacterium]